MAISKRSLSLGKEAVDQAAQSLHNLGGSSGSGSSLTSMPPSISAELVIDVLHGYQLHLRCAYTSCMCNIFLTYVLI